MSAHVQILDQPEPLGRPLVGSLALHVALFGALAGIVALERRSGPSWGDPNSLAGGSVGVNVVKQIPLPSRSGIVNPLANDSESAVPTPPPAAKPQPRAEAPDAEAIALKSRKSQERERKQSASREMFRSRPETANQVYSSAGEALVSPMIGQSGSGGIGVGSGSPFGDRFGYYVDLLRQRVGQKWRTGDVDARIQTAPTAIVTFTIRRDGSASGIRVVQSSGNPALDISAQRAIADASPFPPLPAGYDRDDARIEFHFNLKR
jgi:periplasmic protein TonB